MDMVTLVWLTALTCANIGALGLVVYAIMKPEAVRKDLQDVFQGVQALSTVVAKLDGQVDDVRAMLFGTDEVAPEAPPAPTKKRAPVKKAVSKRTRKTANRQPNS